MALLLVLQQSLEIVISCPRAAPAPHWEAMPSFKAFADLQRKAQEAGQLLAKENQAAAAAATRSHAPDAVQKDDVPETPLRLGLRVMISGLQARPELNGLVGKLTAFDEERGRWQVELEKGGGRKLFKAANLQPAPADDEALDILRGSSSASQVTEASSRETPTTRTGGKGSSHAEGLKYETALGSRSFPRGVYGVGGTPSPAAVAAARALATGHSVVEKDPEMYEDDDEAFVASIERCLKESDVMWDDY